MSTTTNLIMNIDTAIGLVFISVVMLTFLIFIFSVVMPVKEHKKKFNDF